jgi:YbbR domain-containing protein
MHKLKALSARIWEERVLFLFCFIIAFFAWQSIHRNIGHETTVSDIYIETIDPAEWAVLNQSLQRVNITFQGSQEEIRFLDQEDLRVIVPLPDPGGEKELTIRFEESHVLNPAGTRVVRFNPPEMRVKFEPRMRRTVPIKAAFSGSLREGLEIERARCNPAGIEISGAKSRVEKITTLSTDMITLDQQPASFMEQVAVAAPLHMHLDLEPTWVEVSVDLAERVSERRFINVPLNVLNTPREERFFNIAPERIHLIVSGAQKRIERLQMDAITAYVRCNELETTTSYDLPVQVDLPEGIKLIKTEPSVVRVDITP